MHKVLFLTYYFPPITGSGVFRSAKFAKYLPEFGWQPYVISTTEDIGLRKFDPSLLADIPDTVKVWRVPTPAPAPYTRLTSQMRLPAALYPLTWSLRTIERPLVDAQFYWALRIIPLACRIIRKYQIDLIYTSSAPWSVLLTGLLLKRLTGRPWVLDMRDPWISHEYVYRSCGVRRRLDTSIERAALRVADQIVITSWGFVDELHALYAKDTAVKYSEITNGFDVADFAPALYPAHNTTPPYHVAHLGTVIWDAFKPLWAALTRLDAQPEVLSRLRLRFHGWYDPQVAAAVSARQPEWVTLGPLIPHEQATALMQRAEVLLLLLGEQQHWARIYLGKIFEYLGAGRPILGIGPRGVVAELIERCGVGCFVAADDTETISARLQQIATDYSGFLAQYYHPRPEIIAQYERRTLTGRLAQVFEAALNY